MGIGRVKLLVLPGDGVGPEVTAQAVRVLRWFAEHRGLDLTLVERDFGIVNWHKHGTLMPDETWAQIEAADAILFGATGSMDQQGMVPPERLAAADAQDAGPVCQHATRAHATGTLQGQP